jgi:hypothetical protein
MEQMFLNDGWCSRQSKRSGSGSLVVMTSALHAEGREFNPRPEYCFVSSNKR